MTQSVLLAVTGSVAAFKTPFLVRLLKKNGYKVTCVVTKSAEQFVTPFLLENLSEERCYVESDFWQDKNIHIALCKEHDMLVICPASGNSIAKCAQGIADNLVSTICLAFEGPKVIVPAMHKEMINQASVDHNIGLCKQLGYFVVGPTAGHLLSGDSGFGRMVEPEVLVALIPAFMLKPLFLEGRHVLVTAGGTTESIDPVRCISNRSSGQMGQMVACLATLYGASVMLITSNLVEDNGIDSVLLAKSSAQFNAAMHNSLDKVDTLVMAAAISDFVPDYSETKLKRTDQDMLLSLKPTQDILQSVTAKKSLRKTIGFCLLDKLTDTQTPIQKCIQKKCDYMFANTANNLANATRDYHVYNQQTCVDKLMGQDVLTVAYRLLALI